MEILRLLVRQLRMLRLVMDLHRLQIRRRDLAVRTLVLRVTSFLLTGPVREPRFASASVGQRCVGFRLELLRRVLLRLRLSRHRRLADTRGSKGGGGDGDPNPGLFDFGETRIWGRRGIDARLFILV